VFSSYLKKRAEIDNNINSKEDAVHLKIKSELLKIDTNRNLIPDIADKIKQSYRKIKKDKGYCDSLDLRLNNGYLEESIKVGMSAKKVKVQENISKLRETIDKYNKDIINCKEQIVESMHTISVFKHEVELIQAERRFKKLFPLNVLKAAKKKINFIKDSSRLYKTENIKKIRNKKKNCNFSRV